MTAGLDIGDPFRFLETQAEAFSQLCSFPQALIPEAVDILRAAFGDSWIRDQIGKRALELSYKAPKHPLARKISTGGKNDIAELLELATYIKGLVAVPRLGDVIAHMKNPPEYRTSLLQLAYAYRLKSVGADTLELEPSAERGRLGDFACRISGRGVIAECYVPQPDVDDPLAEIQLSFSKITEEMAKQTSKPVIAKIRLKVAIIPSQRKLLEREFFRMLRELEDTPQRFSNNFAELELRRSSDTEMTELLPNQEEGGRLLPNTDAFSVLAVRPISAESIPIIRVEGTRGGPYAGALLVWPPSDPPVNQDTATAIERVANNVRQKLSQTRSGEFPFRMVVVEIPEAQRRDYNVMSAMRVLQERLMGHEGFSAAWIVSRVWKTNFRHGYVGYHLSGKGDSALPKAVFDAMFDIEYKGDILVPSQ